MKSSILNRYLLVFASFMMLSTQCMAIDFGKLVLLGDSITHAEGPRGAGTDPADSDGYRYELALKLDAAGHLYDFVGTQNTYSEEEPNFNPTPPFPNGDKDHEGHSGWTTGQILNGRDGEGKLDDWLGSYTPDHAIVLIGANDLLRLDSPAAIIVGKIKNITDALVGANASINIFVGTLYAYDFEGRGSKQKKAGLDAMNSKIVSTFADDPRVTVVDLHTGFDWTTDTYDGLHPNDQGEKIIAQRFLEAMTAANEHQLTVKLSGNGTGVVTSQPAGIDCGAVCTATYSTGTTVTLSANPASDTRIQGWQGCDSSTASSCTVAMDTSRNVTVTLRTPNNFGNVMFLGSLITQGYDLNFRGYRDHVERRMVDNNDRFHIVGSHRLYANLPSPPAPVVYKGHTFNNWNEGHWHWTTSEILNGLSSPSTLPGGTAGKLDEWLNGYTPHTALVLLGYADLTNIGTSSDDIVNNLATIVNKIKADSPSAKILVGTFYEYNYDLVSGISPSEQQQRLNEVNSLLTGSFGADNGVSVVDLHTDFDWTQLTDGFSPTHAGREVIANRFYSAMEAAGPGPDTLYKLTVNAQNTRSGHITSQPEGIACGAQCVTFFKAGTSTTLIDKLVGGSFVSAWQGCDSSTEKTCTIAMNSDKSVTAIIEQPATHGDFNNDGFADLFWHNSRSGKNLIWFMKNNKASRVATVNTVEDANEKIVGFGDFDGDGINDAMWRNTNTGENGLYIIGSDGKLVERLAINKTGRVWEVAGIADFDGDGKVGVLWRNSKTGVNFLYTMDKNTILSSKQINKVGLAWEIVGVGDFNGDNYADVVWRNKNSGINFLYLMNGHTILKSQKINRVAPKAWKIMGVGDLNGDGKMDLFWRNTVNGNNWLYEMDGPTIIKSRKINRVPAKSAWKVVAIGDLTGDGFDDIVWRHTKNGKNLIYRMNGNNILQVLPLSQIKDTNWQVINLSP